MKKTLIKILTCLLLISVFSLMLTACKDNDDQVNKKIEFVAVYYQDGMMFLASHESARIENGKFSGEPIEVSIPEKIKMKDREFFVTSISARAFENCDFLTSIIIPDYINYIGREAFMGCDALTIYCQASQKPSAWHDDWNSSGCPVVWGYPNNDIASDGFVYTVIDGVRYKASDGVASVARQAKNVTQAEILSNISYKEQDYLVKSIEASAFSESSLTTVAIPDGIENIGGSAFSSCVKLENAILPDSVEFIGDAIFNNCHKLKSVKLPKNQLVIGEKFFYCCYLLENVEIPASVYMINDWAFVWCSSLTKLLIHRDVEYIGKDVFVFCDALTIYCQASQKPTGWNENWSGLSPSIVWDYINNETAEDGYIYVIVDGVRYGIKDSYAVVREQPCSIKQAVIPRTINYKQIDYPVLIIDAFSFNNCNLIESVKISDSIRIVTQYAFYRCDLLEKITYSGTIEQWNNVLKQGQWTGYIPATKVICTDGEVEI